MEISFNVSSLATSYHHNQNQSGLTIKKSSIISCQTLPLYPVMTVSYILNPLRNKFCFVINRWMNHLTPSPSMSLCTLHPPSRRARRSIKPPESTPPTPIPMPNLSGNETRPLPIFPILCPRCPCCCLCNSSFLFHTFISELNVVKPAAQSGFLPVITAHPWYSGVSLSTHFRCRWRPSLLLAIEWHLSTQPFTTNYSPHHTSSSSLKMVPPPGNNWSPSELRIFPHFRVKTAQRMLSEASSIGKFVRNQLTTCHSNWICTKFDGKSLLRIE